MKTFTVNMINHFDTGINEEAFLAAAKEYLFTDADESFINNNLVSAGGMLDWITESHPKLELKEELIEGLKKLVEEDEYLNILVSV